MKNYLPALAILLAAAHPLLVTAGEVRAPAVKSVTCWTEQVQKPELITWDGHRIPQVDSVRRCRTEYQAALPKPAAPRRTPHTKLVATQGWHEIDVDDLVRQREQAERQQAEQETQEVHSR